jgi:hypothetical protein
MLEALANGSLGLTVELPPGAVLVDQSETFARLRDPANGIGWWLFFFADTFLDLRPDYLALLGRDIHRHARVLFDEMFAHDARQTALGRLEPRTSDPEWTPVVEIEPLELSGGRGLSVLHRMQYRAGCESVMGHTLVPIARGLFEARWMCVEQSATGMRESVLMLMADARTGTKSFPSQAQYDDPAHDAQFPSHPLSRARTAKRWHEGRLRVLQPPLQQPDGEVVLAPLGCAIAPPLRFVGFRTVDDRDAISCAFDRVSFSGTDGVDRLVVARTPETIRGIAVARRLEKLARQRSIAYFVDEGHAGADCAVEAASDDGISLVIEGRALQIGAGRGRTAWRWFRDPKGQVWGIGLASTTAVPLEELTQDVAAVARSWRLV